MERPRRLGASHRVRPSGSACRVLRTQQSPRWPTVLRRQVEPPASRLTPQSSYSTITLPTAFPSASSSFTPALREQVLHFAVCSFAVFWRKRWAALGYASPNHRFRGVSGGIDQCAAALRWL